MPESYFVWNGVDSRTMGVIVVKPPPMVYPAERVETVNIPGRSGYLTRTEGEAVYNGYLKTVTIGNKRNADARAIAAWLRGSGTLVFSSEPDFVYEARVIKEASLDRAMPGAYSGAVAWMVQPEKGRMPPEGNVSWTTGAFPSLFNPGDVPAKPLIRVEATSGLLGSGPRIVLGVGEEAIASGNDVPRLDINLTSREDLDGCVIDTSACRILSLDGDENLDAYATVYHSETGHLWMPPKQTSVVSWDSELAVVSSVVITPRWRWL